MLTVPCTVAQMIAEAAHEVRIPRERCHTPRYRERISASSLSLAGSDS
ncbi:MAG: hypothetical protein H6Q55_83 [Deltaproteobacteria bacterium]|nr:hypothetical protein [Deltaproteobacteria bacterium]